MVLADLADHLAQLGGHDDALVFTSPEGTALRHGNFQRRTWLPALSKAGMTGVHFHDLRHAGNSDTASAGANMRELMARMGHSTTRAAMIYLHSTDQRQRTLADAVDKAARRTGRRLGTAAHLARKWHAAIRAPHEGRSRCRRDSA